MLRPGKVTYTYNPSTWKGKVEGLKIQGYPLLWKILKDQFGVQETLSQHNNKTRQYWLFYPQKRWHKGPRYQPVFVAASVRLAVAEHSWTRMYLSIHGCWDAKPWPWHSLDSIMCCDVISPYPDVNEHWLNAQGRGMSPNCWELWCEGFGIMALYSVFWQYFFFFFSFPFSFPPNREQAHLCAGSYKCVMFPAH